MDVDFGDPVCIFLCQTEEHGKAANNNCTEQKHRTAVIQAVAA